MAVQYYSASEAAERRGVTTRRIRQMCQTGELSGAEHYKGKWRIYAGSHPKLRLKDEVVGQGRWLELDGVSPTRANRAIKLLGFLCAAEEFAGEWVRAGTGTWSEGIDAFAVKRGIHPSTYYKRLAKYRRYGLAGLVDHRGGRRGNGPAISEEAFEFFKAFYLDERRFTIALCWRMVCSLNKSEKRGWTVPKLKRMYDVAKRRIPPAVAIYHREGRAAWEKQCCPAMPKAVRGGVERIAAEPTGDVG